MHAERTAPIKRNRSLVADTAWLLEVAARLKAGRLELEPIRGECGARKVRAILMHEEQGVALHGVGRTATEAVHKLREAIERSIELRRSR